MGKKLLKDLVAGDKIYILDLASIDNGFVAYKVIDVNYEEEEYNDSGCGDPYTPERWDIHFTTPYLDRWMTVTEEDLSVVMYYGNNVINDNGKVKTEEITLCLASSLSGVKHYLTEYYRAMMDRLVTENEKDMKFIEKITGAINARNDKYKKLAETLDKINLTL